MPRLRLSLGAMVAAVATLVAMVCLGAPAFALPPPGTNISIISAGPTSGNPYQLTVQVKDANGLQLSSPDGGTTPAMTVHIMNGITDVYDVTTMAFVSGPTSAQIWQQTDQIPQASLPAGTYTMTVDMYDTQESDLGVAAPAPLSFSYTTTIGSLQSNPPTVTAGSQTVTITGTLTGTATGGTPVGLGSGIPVNVAINGVPTTTVNTTDAAGDFSYQPPALSDTTTYTFSVGSTSTYSADSQPITVNAVQATTAINATAIPASVSEGSPPVTISGQVTVTPQGSTSSTGIGANVPVNVAINGVPTTTVNTTDAAGDFSYPAGLISATTTYTFSVASTPLYTSPTPVPVTVQANQAPSTITVNPSPAFVTFGSEDVTFNGIVTALPGGGTTAVPVPNAPVYLNGSTSPIATTDSNGKFSYPVSGITQTTGYTFSVNSTNLYNAPTPDLVTVTATPGTTNIAVTANPPFVNLGSSTVTFSGAVTVGTAALPVPSGTQVYVSVDGAAPVAAGTTDPSGDFTYVANGVTKTTTFNFSVNAGTLYTSATYQVSVNLDQLTTNVTVTPDQTNVTEGSQTVTFMGSVTGISPSSPTTSQPIQGVPVILNGGKTPVATTKANGQFIYQASNIGKASQFDFSVASAPTYTGATVNVAIGVIPAATRFTGVQVVPAHLKYGQKATLSGTVQYRYGTTWTALPGGTVQLFEGKKGLGSVHTGKSGSFTGTLPTTNGTSWRAMVSGAALLQQASAIGNLSISVPMKAKSFAAKLDVLGIVKTSGCLQVTVPVRYSPESKIVIQYAAKSHGPWKTLGRLQLHNIAGAPALCRDANESYFGGSIRAKLANAYYRADFPGNFSFQHTTSSVVHSWRYQTRITNYKVSPRAISTGGKVKITGRLWLRGKSWKPYGKRKVDIVYNEKGTSYWAHLGKPVKTSAGGYFSETAVGGGGKFVAIIYAVYTGSKTDLEAQSPGMPVQVNEAATPGPTPPGPTPTGSKLPVLLLPTYRGLGRLAQDAIDVAAREIRALAFWPR